MRIMPGRILVAVTVILVLGFAVFVMGCGGEEGNGGAQDEPILIGAIGGENTTVGDAIRNGAQLAVDDINAAGGVNGRQLTLQWGDTQLEPERGVAAYQRLAGEKAVAVVGTQNSGVALAVMEQMARAKVPFLATGPTSSEMEALVKKDYERYKYWFHFCHNGVEGATSIASFVNGHLKPEYGVDEVLFFSEDGAWTAEYRDVLRPLLEQEGVKVVDEVVFDVKTQDFNPLLRQVAKSEADQVVAFSAAVNSASYARQWADLEGLPMGGIETAQSDGTYFKETQGRAAYQWTLDFGYPVPITDTTLEFYDKYSQIHQVVPAFSAIYTYDCVMALAEALERMPADSIGDGEALVAELEKTDYSGAVARWVFNDSHHSLFEGYRDKSMVIVQWLPDGTRKAIWPSDVAEQDYTPPSWSEQADM